MGGLRFGLSLMSQALEALLARIYTDRAALEQFLADPQAAAEQAGCSPAEAARLKDPDAVGLRLAHQSFEKKRTQKANHAPKPWWRRVGKR
jgi:hypothetical protein